MLGIDVEGLLCFHLHKDMWLDYVLTQLSTCVCICTALYVVAYILKSDIWTLGVSS